MTLNASGSILRVDIEEPSGQGLFDEAARRSILQLERIGNLPSGLRDSDGLYRIHFGFRVNLESSGFRMDYVPDPRLVPSP
jgi:hypothetical protein